MKYLNAQKGIKKIYASGIFAVCAAVISTGITLLLDILSRVFEGLSEFVSSDWGIICLFLCYSVSFVFMTLTAVLGCVGYYQASKDEPEFKKAMMCTLAVGALTVIGSVFQIPNSTLYTTLYAAAMIVEMFVMVFAVTGQMHLAERCERSDMASKGDVLLKIIVALYIITALNTICIRLFGLDNHTKMIAYITSALDLGLNIVQYVIFLKYLKQTQGMLKESQTGEATT